MAYLSPGETGSFLSTSFPPFANMKCPRFVLPCGFFAPSAATRTRSGSDSRGYGNSFCVVMKKVRVSHSLYRIVEAEVACLKSPFLLSLRFIVTETVNDKVVFRETRVDIAESARLCRATRCATDKARAVALAQWDSQVSALGIEKRITPLSSARLATSTSSPCSFFKMYDGRLSPTSIGASARVAGVSAGGSSTAYG